MAMPNATSHKSPAGVSAVIRTMTILEELANYRAVNLEQLAGATKLPKPTLLRFLTTLVDLGYVHRDTHDLYSLSLKLFSVGSTSLTHLTLTQVATEIAQQLGEKLGETVHMGVLDGHEAIYIVKVESKHTIRMYSQVGKKIPLYCSSIGKVLLSGLPSSDLDTLLANLELRPYTPQTITDLGQLKRELEHIRSVGYGEDNEEYEEGICCLGAPVYDYEGKIIAALSVSWPKFRFESNQKTASVTLLQEAAAQISRRMGYLG